MNIIGLLVLAYTFMFLIAATIISCILININNEVPKPVQAATQAYLPVSNPVPVPIEPTKKYPDTVQEQYLDYLNVMETLKYDSTIEKTRELVHFLIRTNRFPKIALDWFEAQVQNGQISDNMSNFSGNLFSNTSQLNYLTEEEIRELSKEIGIHLTEEEALEILRQREIEEQEYEVLAYDDAHRCTDGHYSRVTSEEEEYYQSQKSMAFSYGE